MIQAVKLHNNLKRFHKTHVSIFQVIALCDEQTPNGNSSTVFMLFTLPKVTISHITHHIYKAIDHKDVL